MSKLANEIFTIFEAGWLFFVAEKRYLKWVIMTYLSNTLDATCNKLHLKCFLRVFDEELKVISLINSGKM